MRGGQMEPRHADDGTLWKIFLINAMPFHVFSMALSLLLIGRVEGTPLLEERISSLESTVAAQIASISSLDETVAGLNAKLGALEEWARGHSEFTSSDGAWRTPRAKTGRSLHSASGQRRRSRRNCQAI